MAPSMMHLERMRQPTPPCPYSLLRFPLQSFAHGAPRNSPVSLAAFASGAALALVTDVDTGAGGLIVLGAVDETLLDIGGKAVEGLVNVDVALGGNLEEGDSQFVGQGLSLLR